MTSSYTFTTSRLEIADAIESAFRGAAQQPSELLEAARGSHASAEVLRALSSLPENARYATLRDVWRDLPHVPVER
jgi:hypothetical protein